jgi:hypothetical protein
VQREAATRELQAIRTRTGTIRTIEFHDMDEMRFWARTNATTDLRLTRRLYVRPRYRLELVAEAFNTLNRDNKSVVITDDGFTSTATDFVQLDKTIGIRYFPAYYQKPTNFVSANSAYAPRQLQFALKLIF